MPEGKTRFQLRKIRKASRVLHKLLGLFVFIPLIIFTITGLLLNHKSDWGLDRARVTSPWVMRQYDFTFEDEPSEWDCGGGVSLVQWNNEVVLADHILDIEGMLIGAVRVNNGFCVGTTKRVYYYGQTVAYTDEGIVEPIEVLEQGLSLPEGLVEKIGSNSAGRLVVQVDGKTYTFVDDDLLKWVKVNSDVRWSGARALSKERYAHFQEVIIGQGFPMDRVILDFHSGNIFGVIGKVLVDVFTVGIVGLSFSGLLLLRRSKRRNGEA